MHKDKIIPSFIQPVVFLSVLTILLLTKMTNSRYVHVFYSYSRKPSPLSGPDEFYMHIQFLNKDKAVALHCLQHANTHTFTLLHLS